MVRAVTPSLRWARFQPKEERVRTHVGQPVEFTAVAEVVSRTRGVEGIQYQWRVNDTLIEQRTPTNPPANASTICNGLSYPVTPSASSLLWWTLGSGGFYTLWSSALT